MDDPATAQDAKTLISTPVTDTSEHPTACEAIHGTSISATSLSFPHQFGQYQLLSEIARGGMGVVYRAEQQQPKRLVAIKMILHGCWASQTDVQRFHTEANAAAKLNHPGIVPIYEVGQCAGQHFFSMALVEGSTLAAKLQRGPLPPLDAAVLVAHIGDAIAYAHQQGIIHRDLKPSNILLDQSGNPLVTDFGVAKHLADPSRTSTGELLGTPSYMPPEQAAGAGGQICPLCDVYALGAILYASVTGRPPFQSANPIDTLHQVMNEAAIPPRRLNSRVPRDLETIILKCLGKAPSSRYQSAALLAEDLRRFVAGEPIVARPPGWLCRIRRWLCQHLLVASLSGITSLAMTAGLVGLAWHVRTTQLANSVLQQQLEQLQATAKLDRQDKSLALKRQQRYEHMWRTAEQQRLTLLAAYYQQRNPTLALLLAAEAAEAVPEYVTLGNARSDFSGVATPLTATRQTVPAAEVAVRQPAHIMAEARPLARLLCRLLSRNSLTDDMPLPQCARVARQAAGRELTAEERTKYVKLATGAGR